MTERQREIVLGYAECSMNAVETGRKLYLSCVTVGYHLNQIKKTTGIDPRSFYGLCKLVQMAKQIGGVRFMARNKYPGRCYCCRAGIWAL